MGDDLIQNLLNEKESLYEKWWRCHLLFLIALNCLLNLNARHRHKTKAVNTVFICISVRILLIKKHKAIISSFLFCTFDFHFKCFPCSSHVLESFVSNMIYTRDRMMRIRIADFFNSIFFSIFLYWKWTFEGQFTLRKWCRTAIEIEKFLLKKSTMRICIIRLLV